MDSCERILRKRDSRIAELETEVRRLRCRLDRFVPDLRSLLRNRGFAIHRCCGSAKDLLLPTESRYLPPYLRALNKYSFRLFLRDVISRFDNVPLARSTKFITSSVYDRYTAALIRWGMLRKRREKYVLSPPVRSFGPTLEWWAAGILHRRFSLQCLWGVRFRGRRPGGDYDVLARLEERIIYLEVKSSPPKQVMDEELNAYLSRVDDLKPSAACFFMDTELRMKDKIVPMFEAALARRYETPSPVLRLEHELFHVGHRLYIVNASGGIEKNLRKVFEDHLRSQG